MPPAPTIADLLPPHMLEKCLQIWHATGANVLCSAVGLMLADFADATPAALHLVNETLSVDVSDRLEGLRRQWEGGQSK